MGSVSQTQYLERCWPSQWRSTETLLGRLFLPGCHRLNVLISLESKLVWLGQWQCSRSAIANPYFASASLNQPPSPQKHNLQGHKISVYSNNLERILQNSMPLDFKWWYNFAQSLSIDKEKSSAWTKSMFLCLSCPKPHLSWPPLFLPRKKGLVLLQSRSCFDGSKSSMKERLFGMNGVYLFCQKSGSQRLRSLPGKAGAKERERVRAELLSLKTTFVGSKHFHPPKQDPAFSTAPEWSAFCWANIS